MRSGWMMILAACLFALLAALVYFSVSGERQTDLDLDGVGSGDPGEATGRMGTTLGTLMPSANGEASRQRLGQMVLVLGDGGRRLFGARVEAGGLRHETGIDGTVSLPDAVTRFSVVHADYTPVVKVLEPRERMASSVTVQLYRTCKLAITIRDLSGALLDGVQTTVTRGSVDPGTHSLTPDRKADDIEIRRKELGAVYRKTSRSGFDGRSKLEGLHAGKHRVFLEKAGYYMVVDPNKEVSSATTDLEAGENHREYRMGRLYYAAAGFEFETQLSDRLMRSFHGLSAGFPKGLMSLSPDMASLGRGARQSVHVWLAKRGFDREWILIARERPTGPRPPAVVRHYVKSRLMWGSARRIPVVFRPLTALGIGSVERVVLRGGVETGRLKVQTPFEIRIVYMEGRRETFYGHRVLASADTQECDLPVGSYQAIPASSLLDKRNRMIRFTINKGGLTQIAPGQGPGFGWLVFSVVDVHGKPTTDHSISVQRDEPATYVAYGGGKGASFRVPCEPGSYRIGKRNSAMGRLGSSIHRVEIGRPTKVILEMKK